VVVGCALGAVTIGAADAIAGGGGAGTGSGKAGGIGVTVGRAGSLVSAADVGALRSSLDCCGFCNAL
jgi:hypothetical protein